MQFDPTAYVTRERPFILEIGANDGADTNRMLDLFPNAQIACFECDPRAIGRFKLAVRSPRATLHEIALREYTGRCDFHPSGGNPPGWNNYGDWDKSGSVLEPDQHSQYHAWLKFHPPIRVPCTTLDEWATARKPGTIDLAWVDVQGAEHLVLAGARETLPKVRYWYAECHALPYYKLQAKLGDLDKALAPRFVRMATFDGENFLWENRDLQPQEKPC